MIWNPHIILYDEVLEKIQKIIFLYFKRHGVYPAYRHLVSYEFQLAEFAVSTLSTDSLKIFRKMDPI